MLDQAGQALANGNKTAWNAFGNAISSQLGYAAPKTFDALKQIVGTEIEKAIAGGIGSSADRDRLMDALNGANSPAQLKSVTDGFRSLMVGQLSGLKAQYEDATGIKAGPFAFEGKLAPETAKALGSSPTSPAPAPAPTSSTQSAKPPTGQRMTAQQAVAQARQELDQSGIPYPPDLYNKKVEQRATALLSAQGAAGQPTSNPALQRLWGQ